MFGPPEAKTFFRCSFYIPEKLKVMSGINENKETPVINDGRFNQFLESMRYILTVYRLNIKSRLQLKIFK